MSFADKIKLLLEWSPVINFLIAISSATPGKDRVYRTLELLDYLANKTPTPVDNELVELVKGVLLTPQGAELLEYLSKKVQPLLSPPSPQIRLYEEPEVSA